MKIVIVGGGFAGVKAALSLANKKSFEVRLVSDQTYFEYHAAMYRSATGRSPLEVAIPLREFFSFAKNVEVVQDKIVDIDNETKQVTGNSGSRYGYDSLVLALGNVTEHYGIKGLKEHSHGVKTIHESLKLKRTLHEQLIANQADNNYVVVGGGATGIELSAELTFYLKKIRKRHHLKKAFNVNLIEAGPKLLGSTPDDFSDKIEERLNKIGVKTLLNTAVKSENVDSIKLPHGSIKTHTSVWTAGTTNNPLFKKFPKIFKLGRMNRVEVDEHLRAAPDIYVVGDSAQTKYSGMAQTALHDATFVANNLVRQFKGKDLKKYSPQRPIYAIPVGRRWAAVLWGEKRIYGWLGWVVRRLADLRLYLTFLPLTKALVVWRYGFQSDEACPVCKQ